jgi:hypothetical protein
VNPEDLKKLAKRRVEDMARDISAVQPMPPTIFQDLIAAGKSREWLEENGYRPVDGETGLLWIKKV